MEGRGKESVSWLVREGKERQPPSPEIGPSSHRDRQQ